ncbi:MAG: hypothetical protein LBU35_00415, partial [Holosporales bacterium]|nr:hypothetical protein [Holosporales bacterium]
SEEGSGEKGSKKQDEEIDSLGISVSKIPESRMDQYQKDVKVIVTRVDDSKESSFFGPIFEPGDGIISANNQKVTSVAQFKKIIDDIKNDKDLKGKQIPFVINRGRSMMFLSTTIDFPSEKEPAKKKK